MQYEIQSLLILHGSASEAISALFKKYRTEKLSRFEIESIAIFCLHAGAPASLLDFLITQLRLGAELPWGHFAEAYALSQTVLEPEIARSLIEGARSQKLASELIRSRALDSFDQNLSRERDEIRQDQQSLHQRIRNEMLLQVEMLRSQELEEDEGKILERLLRMFPQDSALQELAREFRSRKAVRTLEARLHQSTPSEPSERETPPTEETRQAMDEFLAFTLEEWEKSNFDDRLGLDFAVAHWMIDHPEGSLDFLPQDPNLPASVWMRLELLLQTRRYLELLELLSQIETRWSDRPETTYAVSYLRAQAFWGLGRKGDAISLLEGLLTVQPQYRGAPSLLKKWKRGAR